MKSATLPAVRVEPELRDTLRQRLSQAGFVARGSASIDAAQRSGLCIDASAVVDKRQQRLSGQAPESDA